MCQQDKAPFIKWFSTSDVSSEVFGITCFRVNKQVTGFDWKTWAGWFKLVKYLDRFPFE